MVFMMNRIRDLPFKVLRLLGLLEAVSNEEEFETMTESLNDRSKLAMVVDLLMAEKSASHDKLSLSRFMSPVFMSKFNFKGLRKMRKFEDTALYEKLILPLYKKHGIHSKAARVFIQRDFDRNRDRLKKRRTRMRKKKALETEPKKERRSEDEETELASDQEDDVIIESVEPPRENEGNLEFPETLALAKTINAVVTVDDSGFVRDFFVMDAKDFAEEKGINLSELRQSKFSCPTCQESCSLSISFKFPTKIEAEDESRVNIKLVRPEKEPQLPPAKNQQKKPTIVQRKEKKTPKKEKKEFKPFTLRLNIDPVLQITEVQSSSKFKPFILKPKTSTEVAAETPTDDLELDEPMEVPSEDLFEPEEANDDFESGFTEDIVMPSLELEEGLEGLEEHWEEISKSLSDRKKCTLIDLGNRPWWDPFIEKPFIPYTQCQDCRFEYPVDKEGRVLRGRHRHIHYVDLCEICGKVIPRKWAGFFKDHFLTDHTPNGTKAGEVKCEFCQKKLKNQGTLFAHVRAHCKKNPNVRIPPPPPKLICDFCGYSISRKSEMELHMNNKHMQFKKILYCPECSFQTCNPPSLRKHKKETHTAYEEKRLQCPGCSLRFAYVTSLKKHMITHSEKRAFVCIICGKGYKHAGDLKNHMYVHSHSGDLPYSCRFCDRKFQDRGNKNAHQRNTHPKEWERYKKHKKWEP